MKNKVIKYGVMVGLLVAGFFLGYEISGGFEDLSLTQVGIPFRGQANIIFESEESQVLTIEYYMKATDTETNLFVNTFELQDNGFYKWRR